MRRGVFRNYYKGHRDKTKGEGGGVKWEREVGLPGVGGRGGEKMQTTLIAVSYTHLTLPTNNPWCRSRWSPYH